MVKLEKCYVTGSPTPTSECDYGSAIQTIKHIAEECASTTTSTRPHWKQLSAPQTWTSKSEIIPSI